MANFNKITASDLNGKGVTGLPDTPALTASEMQRKFDEIPREVIVPKFNEAIEMLNENDAAKNFLMERPDEKHFGSTVYQSVKAIINTISKALFDIADTNETPAQTIDKKIGTVNNTVNTALTTAQNANRKATSALDTSDTAVRIANDALDTSTQLIEKTDEALNKAEDANSKAETATETAATAGATASLAEDLANAALNIADEAKATADGIADTANTALTIAQSASATATSASATANSANETAELALEEASKSKTSIDDTQPTLYSVYSSQKVEDKFGGAVLISESETEPTGLAKVGRWLLDVAKEKIIIPFTTLAHVLAEDGTPLSTLLEKTISVGEEGEEIEGANLEEINAKKLDGHSANYFATAEEVGTISEDVETLKEDVSGLNADLTELKKYNFDSPIAIADSGVFTAPCDGYAEFLINDSSGYAYYIINHLVNVRVTTTQGVAYGAQTLFIKKGMRIEFVASNGDHSAKFYPLA